MDQRKENSRSKQSMSAPLEGGEKELHDAGMDRSSLYRNDHSLTMFLKNSFNF